MNTPTFIAKHQNARSVGLFANAYGAALERPMPAHALRAAAARFAMLERLDETRPPGEVGA